MESRFAPRVGVDIVEIAKVEKFIQSHSGSLARLYTEREIAYCRGKKNSAERFAARFAAKEAVLKALGDRKIDLKNIEIVNNFWGKPQVYIHDQAEL
jgi:holo-[acyl-carrier protein] synthase